MTEAHRFDFLKKMSRSMGESADGYREEGCPVDPHVLRTTLRGFFGASMLTRGTMRYRVRPPIGMSFA